MSEAWTALVIVDLAVTYVCFMKGKKLMGWIGVVGVIPPLTFVLFLVPLIGAMTPAKPGSKWDRPPLQLPPPPADAWRYAPTDSASAPDPSGNPQPGQSPVDAYVDGGRTLPPPQRSTPANEQTGESVQSSRSVEIRAFLKRAVAENIIDGPTHVALVRHLEEQRPSPQPSAAQQPAVTPVPSKPIVAPAPPPPERVAVPPPPPAPPPTPPLPVRTPTPPPLQPSPVRTAPSRAAVAVPAPAPEPPKPREPSRFAMRRAELWDAFTSDVAVHGLVYLGVLLTFVSVLGFMLFAFKDLPISAKPSVELLIVLTFFGWAWVLHHQNATRVAKAMELLGGMILPLVWYAALVDSAGVPPDAEGDTLVLALVVSSLVLSGLYWLISLRFDTSMLRFLVWPMVWVAAMGVGFAFKTDEHLVGDAITRLVAPQPALASVVIAASLAFLMWRSDARLAKPTYIAALAGIPSAYLLTFGLSLADGIAVSWPIIVSGAGTVASIELVAHWYGWQTRLRPLRPYVYAVVGVPLVLAIGVGWGGAIVAVTYVVLAEIAIRSPKIKLHDVTSAAAGAVVGLLLSLAEPGAAVVTFGIVSIWAHVRRRFAIDDISIAQSLDAVAALAPLGLLFGLSELTTTATAILMVTGLVLLAAVVLRVRGHADDFDSIWFPASASALGAGAALLWTIDGSSATIIVASVGVSSAIVALGQRWPTANLWLSAALATIAVSISLETLDATPSTVALTWSAIGIAVIVMSMATRGAAKLRVAPGHLSILGHVVGLFAVVASTELLGLTIAITGWAIGWALSFAAADLRGGVNPLELWATPETIKRDTPATLENHLDAVAPSVFAVTATAAAAAIFIEVTSMPDEWRWLGVVAGAVAITYAIAAKWLIQTIHGRTVLGWAAAILAVVGVGLSYAEPRAIVASSMLVVAVRITLHRVVPLTWLTWVTWLMPAVASAAAAHELGLADDSLATITLGIGVSMLLGALVFDEVANGPRVAGQFTRTKWLLPPASIGAVLIPASVAVLYVGESTASDWAASAAALALALASIMLRRSIWLTAAFASVALAVGFHASHVPAVGSAVVWSVLGLVMLVVAPVTPTASRDDVAGIGHAVGAVGLAYALDETALLVALSAWGIGWLIGVATFELGGPSITAVLERSSRWWDESYGSWTTTVSRGIPPVMAVGTTTAATLVVYDEFATFTDARMWIGPVIGLLGLAFALTAAWLLRSTIASHMFGWGGLILAAGAIVVALPGNLAIAATTTLFVITRIAVVRLIPDPWLNWVTWLMPTAAATAVASAMGVPDASLAVVPIVAGGAMLLGGLLADGRIKGRRTSGEFIRTQWLIAPAVLGALMMAVGVALLRDAATSQQLWAGAGVALTYSAASLLLRRSIWLTSILGAAGLGLILEAADASAVESATSWAVLGVSILASVPFAKGLQQTHLAAIGHIFGLGAFAYSDDPDAYLIALTAWSVGWMGSVVAWELGSPSVARMFADSPDRPEGERNLPVDQVAAAVPSVLAVVTSTALALTAHERFFDFADADMWTAVVLASLGVVFAASCRFVIRSKPAPSVFGWSGLLLAGIGVLAAIGQDVPVVIAATAFIVVRILLIGAIPQTWLSWPAWLMPTVIVVAGGHALGVPGQSVYLLSLASGATMMIGSLVFDDVRSSRRAIGEGLRTPWLRYPFVLGLLVVPLSLAPVFALDTTTVGIASLAAAAGYLVVAVLLRAGAVSAPSLGLAVFGTAFLLPTSAVHNPWILVAMAALVTGWSFIAERMQGAAAAANPWIRWDLPALSVAHLITVTAVLLTFDGSPDPATWVSAGALSMVVGIWRKNRWWIDAGLLLVVAGSGLAGEPWLFIALVVTAARGMYGVPRHDGVARWVDHAIAVTAIVAAWIDLAVLADWTYVESVSYGSVTAGVVAVAVAALSLTDMAKRDTFLLWSSIGLAGVVVATIAGFNAVPVAVDGPWLAIGIALIAVSSEQWARVIHHNARFGTPVLAALAWIVLLTGLDLSDVASASATSVTFGLALAASALIARRIMSASEGDDERNIIDAERVWAVVSLTGIAVAISLTVSLNTTELWWATAAGLLLTTFAVATGGRAVGIARLRIGSGLPALGAFAAVLTALDISAFGIGISMIVGAAAATLVTVWLVIKRSGSDWIETVLIAGIAATGIAVPIAAAELPTTELIVMILLAVGGQAIAYGVVFDRQALVAFGPPALGLAAIMLVVESASGSALWFTVPIAVVMLAEADILHRMTADDRDEQRSVALLILEWSGVALLGLPPLVEMFTTNITFGLVGFGFAVALMMWALLTKVMRRVLAACVVATLSVMLTLAAAAVSNVQDSAAFWIIGGGIGFSIMLIAGFVEAYRSRSGALMTRLGDLMEDWE